MRLIDADMLKEDLSKFYDNIVTARELIDSQPTVEQTQHWDYFYESACVIVQAFVDEYPFPNVLELIKALSFIATKRNTISTDEIIKWAKDYCAEWYDKHMKDGEQE